MSEKENKEVELVPEKTVMEKVEDVNEKQETLTELPGEHVDTNKIVEAIEKKAEEVIAEVETIREEIIAPVEKVAEIVEDAVELIEEITEEKIGEEVIPEALPFLEDLVKLREETKGLNPAVILRELDYLIKRHQK